MDFRWYAIKSPIITGLGLSPLTIHLIVGGVLYLAFVWVFRNNTKGSLIAWSLVLIIEIINELMDIYDWIRWEKFIDIPGAIADVFVTMAIPTMLILISFTRRSLKKR